MAKHWRVTYRGGPLDGTVHESLAAMRPHKIGVPVMCWYELDGDNAAFVSGEEMDVAEIRAATFDDAAKLANDKAEHYDRCREMSSAHADKDYYESQAAVAANLGTQLKAKAAKLRAAV